MQQLSKFNQNIRFLFVAVDTLSRFLWVVPLKNKTAVACRDALVEILGGIKRGLPRLQPLFCRRTTLSQRAKHVQKKPEKIWVDRGREFAREFASFCSENEIKIYSTFSETKSVFAERQIRSLKSLIFKYLHENNTEVYHDKLQDFVTVINSRVNRITKLINHF